jgi:hypothetical protein
MADAALGAFLVFYMQAAFCERQLLWRRLLALLAIGVQIVLRPCSPVA